MRSLRLVRDLLGNPVRLQQIKLPLVFLELLSTVCCARMDSMDRADRVPPLIVKDSSNR